MFSEVDLQVNRDDRIGLIGPNGAGKSTLFQLILGNDQADEGSVVRERGTTMGYLPQESEPVGDETVLELSLAVTPDFVGVRRKILAWDAAHPQTEGEEIHDDVHDRFNELGGYRLEAKAKRILKGLGFREKDFDRPARELSGGWVMRGHLARLLVAEPDLLMLDEPTNHLDLETLLWFQNYLRAYPGGLLIISHDRAFLNALVGSIVEIRLGRLIQYRGDYDDYLVQQVAREEQIASAYKNQEKEIARLMIFVNRFRAKNTKAAQAQSKLKQIERMEKLEAPAQEEGKIGFKFPQPQRSGHRVITLKNIDHAYGPQVVYQKMNFEAERGQRVVLVGPNGAGKSTLLKLLGGVLQPQAGERILGHNVKAGYYSQYRLEMLDETRTVLEEAFHTPQPITEQYARTILGCFLFRGDDVFKKVSVLSGGEKSRLSLIKLLLDPPNLLLMDEPTTHLDLNSIDALTAALNQFQGTLIFISHDVYFIRSLANRVVHVNAGQLRDFSGGYDYYLDKSGAGAGAGSASAALPLATLESAGPRKNRAEAEPQLKGQNRQEQKRLEAEQRQKRSGAKKAQQARVSGLEKEISQLEVQLAELTTELEKSETYETPGRAMQINRELCEVQEQLAERTKIWESEATKLTSLS